MSVAQVCTHCELPVGRLGRQREVNGEAHWFCCYGCSLAYQVHHGERAEPEAAALLIRLGVGAFLAMNIMLFSLLLYSGALTGTDAWLKSVVIWLLWFFATPLLIVLGGPFIAGAVQALRHGRLTADTLVALGALAAYGYSAYQVIQGSDLVYFDTVTMVLVLFTLGRYLEAQGRVRAARSLAPMLAAERADARIVAAGGETIRPVREVQRGDVVRILPGERVPVDGTVLEGDSDCDETVLTGQPERQPKAVGAFVYAGSVNGTGQLVVRAAVAGIDTRWVRIGRLVREALAAKSLLSETIDRAAAIFIPGVLLLAAGTVWYWAGRVGLDAALLTGLAVLVVACPCSLGLAAPLASALAIGQAAQRGILVRAGGVFEKLTRVGGIAFDKTGTLTEGGLHAASLHIDGATEVEVLRRAGMLALGSDHPIARAVVAIGRDRALDLRAANEIQVRPGAGMEGWADGVRCAMGSAAYMATLGWPIPESLVDAAPRGVTVAYIGWDGAVHGLLVLAETPARDAGSAISALHERGIETVLLSGDGECAVALTAARLGIVSWRSELAPEEKVAFLREWSIHSGPVAMVGDGLNDGPVLAAASVGIAVGTATDLAKESADVVLPPAGLADLPWLLQLADHVRRSVRANIFWAFAYNALALGAAVAGLLQPIVAAGLMAGSSLVVVGRSWRAHRKAGGDAMHREGAALGMSALTEARR